LRQIYDDKWRAQQKKNSGIPLDEWSKLDAESVSVTDSYFTEDPEQNAENSAQTPSSCEKLLLPRTTLIPDVLAYRVESCLESNRPTDVIFPHFWLICWPRSKSQVNLCLGAIKHYIEKAKRSKNPDAEKAARLVAIQNKLDYDTLVETDGLQRMIATLNRDTITNSPKNQFFTVVP